MRVLKYRLYNSFLGDTYRINLSVNIHIVFIHIIITPNGMILVLLYNNHISLNILLYGERKHFVFTYKT